MRTHSIIVPACGDGARFGTDAPKHLVDISGKPMVQRVIDALPEDIDIYLLVRPEYEALTRERVRAHNLAVVPVPMITHSVCETLLFAPVRKEDCVLVINCDNVIVPAIGWHEFLRLYKNVVVTFPEQDTKIQPPPFSYVRTYRQFVVEIAEKVRIGPLACAGAFLFEDYEMLRLLCKWHLKWDPPDYKQEHYLAPVYSRLIESTHVYNDQLTSRSVFVRMGTPLEATEARSYYVSRDTRPWD